MHSCPVTPVSYTTQTCAVALRRLWLPTRLDLAAYPDTSPFSSTFHLLLACAAALIHPLTSARRSLVQAGIMFHNGMPCGADLRYLGPGNQRRGRADQFSKVGRDVCNQGLGRRGSRGWTRKSNAGSAPISSAR